MKINVKGFYEVSQKADFYKCKFLSVIIALCNIPTTRLMKEVSSILDFYLSNIGYIFFVVYSKAELLDNDHKCTVHSNMAPIDAHRFP